MTDDLAAMQRFAAEGVVIDRGPGGLPRVAIDRGGATGEVFLHGATVTRWRAPGAAEVLWVSGSSRWQADAPIRGGIPVCFPWFGPHPTRGDLPAHGFARVRAWTLVVVEPLAVGARVALELGDDAATRALWPHRFRLRLEATFARELTVALTGTVDGGEVACDAALHTYLAVADVRRVALHGLAGMTFIDKVRAAERQVEGEAPLRIAGETDRVYLGTDRAVRLDDPSARRSLSFTPAGAGATVVWNPWIDKAKRMPDFGDDEWPGMICVETANAADAGWRLGATPRTMRVTIAAAATTAAR
ncbi:MAG TPA: D-hexose-6-phosphate mutarotase [Planctomycetota bacterium]|nr:D-hexose-6-phosphate mutarotase [Planctomycetota bacterium]